MLAGLRPLELPQLLEQESRHMSIRVNLLENPLFKEQYERDMRTAMLDRITSYNVCYTKLLRNRYCNAL